jgi:hypothetical protein
MAVSLRIIAAIAALITVAGCVAPPLPHFEVPQNTSIALR